MNETGYAPRPVRAPQVERAPRVPIGDAIDSLCSNLDALREGVRVLHNKLVGDAPMPPAAVTDREPNKQPSALDKIEFCRSIAGETHIILESLTKMVG